MNKYLANKYSKTMAIMLVMMVSVSFGQTKKELKPKKFVSTVHLSGKSDFIYYALSEKVKTTVEVEGPGKLIVYNRIRIEKEGVKSKPYYLKYMIDNKLVKSKQILPKPKSTKIKYKSKKIVGFPSKANKEIIKIPPGKHKLSFYKYKTSQKVHTRFVYEQSKKMVWNEIKDKNNNNEIVIRHIKKNKQQKYYRIDDKKGFKFPSGDYEKVRVYLRADFNYKMYTENVVRVVLKKDGKKIKTYKMTCRKSNVVENLTDKKLVPGGLEKIYIDIPKAIGQNYELVLKDNNASALVRVFTGTPKSANPPVEDVVLK